MRSFRLVAISTSLIGLVAVLPSASLAGTRVPVRSPAPRVAATGGDDVTSLAAVPASPDIDVRGLRRHVKSIAKLVGHPAHELAARLGAAAVVGDGTIEWNLAKLGVDAASAYGYASVVDGMVTGFVIRGRAALDQLVQLHLHGPLQLTVAGGERPSYSIAVGE